MRAAVFWCALVAVAVLEVQAGERMLMMMMMMMMMMVVKVLQCVFQCNAVHYALYVCVFVYLLVCLCLLREGIEQCTLSSELLFSHSYSTHTIHTISHTHTATLTTRISRLSEESKTNGAITLEDNKIDLAQDRPTSNLIVEQLVGLNFVGLGLPKGAVVTNAYIRFTAVGADSDSIAVSIQADNSASPAGFGSRRNDLSNRLRTSASVTWPVPNWLAGSVQQTPNISVVIQQVISQPDWSSGNDLVIIIDRSSGTGRRRAFPSSAGAQSPELTVVYNLGKSRLGKET